MKTRLDSAAEAEVRHNIDWIEERNPAAALKVARRIRSSIDRLGSHPRLGHATTVLFREWPIPGLPYIIVYEVREEADEVVVRAVFHGARDRRDV